MTTKRRVLVNASMSALQVVVSGGTLFVLYRFLLQTIGEADFGVWALVMAWTSASAIANLGLSGSAVKFVAQHLARGDDAYVRQIVQTSVLTVAVFLGLVLIGFYPLLGWGLTFLVEPATQIPAALAVLPYALVSFWMLSGASVLQSCIDGLHRIDLRCLLVMAGSVAYLGFVLLLVPERGLIGLAQAQVAQSALLLGGAWILTKRLLPGLPLVPWRWDRGAFREMLAYSLNFQVISFARLLFEPITKSLLSKFGGVGVLAYFEMAHKMVLQLRALVVTAHRAIVPAIADLQERDAARVRSIYATSFRLLLYFILPSLPLLIGMTPVISRLYVGFYEPYFVVFADVLFAGWFLNMLANPAYFANMGTGTLRPNVWGHVTIGVLNGVLGGLLGWLFGSVGVVVGFVVALLTGSALIAALYHRAHGIRLSDLAGRASLLLGTAGLAGGVLVLLLYDLNRDALGLAALSALLPAAYLAVVAIPLWRHPVRQQMQQWLVRLLPHRAAQASAEG